jgi:hypothetical protein
MLYNIVCIAQSLNLAEESIKYKTLKIVKKKKALKFKFGTHNIHSYFLKLYSEGGFEFAIFLNRFLMHF